MLFIHFREGVQIRDMSHIKGVDPTPLPLSFFRQNVKIVNCL